MTRTQIQQRIIDEVSGGGSVPGRQIINRLSNQYGETTVKKEFAELVLEGVIREHPDFEGCFVVDED